MFECEAVIFDLDGTLVDSIGVWEKIDRDFFRNENINMPEDYIEKVNSMSFEEVAKYTIKKFDLKYTEKEIINKWNDMAIFEYSNNIKLKPNAKKFIKNLKKNNIKIGLATSSPKELYEPVLKNNDIYQYFDICVSVVDINRSKNYPDIYLHIVNKLNVNCNNCVGIEDLAIAADTMKKIGFKVIGIYDKYSANEIEKLKKISDKFIYDFEELI